MTTPERDMSKAVVTDERPLTPPISRKTDETWKQVVDLFQHHGIPEPPFRLRDELVTAFEWAWYGQSLSAALSHGAEAVEPYPAPESHVVVLAPKHTGMKVDYCGLINQARRGLQRDPGIAEMLRQLEEHMSELGRRWYDGDATVVDEFLQLYCIQTVRRGVIAAAKAEGQPDAG